MDRLHHGEVFYLRGSSYRMRGKELVTLTAKPEQGVGESNGTVEAGAGF